MLGVFLSLILLILITAGIIGAAISSLGSEKTVITESNSVLSISLDHPVMERGSKNPFANLDLSTMKSRNPLGLDDILKNIKKAATDDKIKGIYLNVSSVQAGIATVEEIRNALIDFKKSGKFVIAYAESYSQGAYYLVSPADRIYLNPQGEIDFKGLRAELAFFKGTLEKLEIEPQVIRHGKFKSAIEPFINDKMSDENRSQIADLIDDLWNHMVNRISSERNIPAAELRQVADSFVTHIAEEALRVKLVDALKYEDEVISELKTKTGTAVDKQLSTITLGKYNRASESGTKKTFVKEKIAVIYASGTIEGGRGDERSVGSETFAEAIKDAAKDNNIKAIVLRVNSPGGSAMASEVIWRELMVAKKTKPVVVSMGDLAASGGYYIACAGDSILAQENTITGSIGVFGLLFNMQKLLVNKLGITTDTYKTSTYADLGTPTRPLTEGEKRILQNSVEKIYDTFTLRVSAARKMSQADVDSIGQGRVWSGTDALRLGLVDRIGGINDAIEMAARMAKISDYRISSLPEQKDTFQEILTSLKDETEAGIVERELGTSYSYYKNMQTLLKIKGVQALMPFNIVTQ